MTTEIEAFDAVQEIVGAFPEVPVGPKAVEVYTRHLMALPDSALLRAAVSQIVATGDRFPRIAAIRETYFSLSGGRSFSARVPGRELSEREREEAQRAYDQAFARLADHVPTVKNLMPRLDAASNGHV
jgi:hypothetical protein